MRLTRWLWAGCALFAFRVGAQLLQWQAPVKWLPGFAAWHSATLPYPWLLTAQLVILGTLIGGALRHSRGWARQSVRAARALRALGLVYASGMALRLAVGVLWLPEHPWFGKALPALFHLVLAGYVLALAGLGADQTSPRREPACSSYGPHVTSSGPARISR